VCAEMCSERLGYHLEPNLQTARALASTGGQILLDQRVRPLGCHHQKFVAIWRPRRPADDVAFVGGIDLGTGLFFVSGNLLFALVGLFFAGVGMALLNTMTWALQADTVEYGGYQTGIRTEGAAGCPIEDAYWQLVVDDITAALAVLRPVFDASGGTDGFASVEVAAELARDTQATLLAARALHERITTPNLFVKIPATAQGVPAVQTMIAEGRSINITLIFSLARYRQIIESYLSGLESFTERGGDPSRVHSVASFFVSRVDTEVDRRLETAGTDQRSAPRIARRSPSSRRLPW
jgi:hypothetical protein